MNKGKLIVIDGLDGSGKATQTALLCQKLSEMGLKIKKITFPDYNSPSSSLVKMYLAGDLSKNLQDINAYAAASFYSVDRYASFIKNWKNDYNNGAVIIADRYTTSNATHQMVKLEKSNWDSFLYWLMDFEYNKLAIPAPDRVIYLDMPVEISQKLINSRYKGDVNKKDIHEKNLDYLKSCRPAALYAAQKLNWTVINCSCNDEPLSIENISNQVFDNIADLINY